MDPCIQDTLSSRAALGLPLGRVRRASKGILHTTWIHACHTSGRQVLKTTIIYLLFREQYSSCKNQEEAQTSEGIQQTLRRPVKHCIQYTLSSRAALGLPLGRVRRASKGILHTI